jgi:hypothetical protein
MAAKKKKARKAKKTRKPAKRMAAKKKSGKRKVAKKKAAPRKKKTTRAKAIAKALAPSMERLRTGATEMGQGMVEGGRVLIGEAKDAGKEAQDKVKEITTDWWNRPS